MEIKKEYYNQAKPGSEYRNDWWGCDEKEVFQHLVPLVRYIRQNQAYRRTANIRHARLYSNLDVLGLFQNSAGRNQAEGLGASKLSLNVVAAVVDTLSSKIAKAKPRTVYLTDEGAWGEQQRAMKLQRFMEGWRQAADEYETKQRAFVDACVFGTGFVKYYVDTFKNEVCSERVIPDEIDVDDAEAIYGEPRNLYQSRYVSREILLKLYPDKEAEIKSATAADAENMSKNRSSDMVVVVEAWHLPTGKGMKDGRHVIVCDSCTLLDEPWEWCWFPFSKIVYKPRISGWFGIGVAESLMPLQVEINKTIKAIERAHRLMAVPRIYLNTASNINQAQLTNEIGSIIPFAGPVPPIESPGTAMPAQVYSYLENLWNKAFAQEGVSQLSAASMKPAGLNSGAALREYQDVESERFQLLGQRYESSFLESDKIVIEMTKRLDEQVQGGVKVRLGGYKNAETIKWREVKLDEDKYIIRAFPASILPSTPAGRLQTVTELLQSGFIDKETGMNLLDFPDLKDATTLYTANQRLVKKIVDDMVMKAEYTPPEPYFGLQFAKDYAQLSYIKGRMDGVPDDRLELLRTFMSDVQVLLDKAQAPDPMMQAQMMAQGASPVQGLQGEAIASPQAPPVSDMLPV